MTTEMKMLNFGTAGLRGRMADGLGYMNIDAIRWASQGLSDVITEEKLASRGIVIAWDSRINSYEFAAAAAEVFAGNGIHAYMFDTLRPTPELSFAIRKLGAAGGANITASHNTSEYNGYKAYWSDGAQLGDALTIRVSEAMQSSPGRVRSIPFDEGIQRGLISVLGSDIDESFISVCLAAVPPCDIPNDFTVVYTPLHGAGAAFVPEILRRLGVKNLVCVEEQMQPDGRFPTVAKPNPEEPDSFRLALNCAADCGAKLILATDPDSDRLGVMTLHKGAYVRLTGNALGALLADWLLRMKHESGELKRGDTLIKSFVSTDLAAAVAAEYGVETVNTVTGFRFIAEVMAELETCGRRAVFAFEESCGYLAGAHARDKDAVSAAALTAAMAAYYHAQGMSLVDALDLLFKKHGCYRELTVSLELGEGGTETVKKRLAELSYAPPVQIGGLRVNTVRDFSRGLNSECVHGHDNMLCFELEGGCRYVLRPSGTEPKVKLYLLAHGADEDECVSRLSALEAAVVL